MGKILLQISATLVGLIWIVSVMFLISIDFQILDPHEQQKLKEGKHFWNWDSPHGSLAMHYIEKGEGDNHLILIHGFRAHTFTWREVISPLAQAGYHVWAIDLVGYGFSDKPINAPYDVDFFVQQVVDFMDAHGIPQAHFIGNSMGGGLALNVALHHPELTQSLTLLSALGYPLDLPLYVIIGRHFNKLWKLVMGPTIIRSGLKQIVYNPGTITEEQVEAYSLPYRFPGGTLASLLTLRQFDNKHLVEMGKRYTALTMPLLLIWGEKDQLIPVSHYEKFRKDFPHASCLLIDKCGHIPQEEEPEQVVGAILNFLTEFKGK